MIFSLGELKDNGLQVVALKEALQQTESLDEASSDRKAYQLLGSKQPKMKLLLEKSAAISKKYFEEKNLDALVAGTAKQS
jgi:hypothetical protein